MLTGESHRSFSGFLISCAVLFPRRSEPCMLHIQMCVSRSSFIAQYLPLILVIGWRDDVPQNLDFVLHRTKPISRTCLWRYGYYFGKRLSEACHEDWLFRLLHLIEQSEALGLEFGDGDFFHLHYWTMVSDVGQYENDEHRPGRDQRRFRASSSSRVLGQSDPRSRDRLRSARTLPAVWQRAQ